MSGPAPYEVVKDWTMTYPNPITCKAAEPLQLTGRTEIWDGHLWLWAINDAGLEGWVPDALVPTADRHREKPCQTIALWDYSALELTCRCGDRLSVSQATHGWMWCLAEDGRQGWVPDRHLAPAQ